jgi:hypothetical protein
MRVSSEKAFEHFEKRANGEIRDAVRTVFLGTGADTAGIEDALIRIGAE